MFIKSSCEGIYYVEWRSEGMVLCSAHSTMLAHLFLIVKPPMISSQHPVEIASLVKVFYLLKKK